MKLTARALIFLVSVFYAGRSVAFAAAPVAYVPAVSQVVTAARLQKLSDAAAHRLIKDQQHQVVLAYPLSDQHIISGHIELHIDDASSISPTYATFPIEIRVDGVLVRTIYSGYRIVTLVDTPVLNEAKHHGDILELTDFHSQRLADDGRPHIDLSELAGRTLNADHAAGSSVRLEETSINTIVKAGSPVVLIVHDGSVALAADVIARTSGGLGETVTVYDENARKMLSGVVTAPSRVELTLPEVSDQ